MSKCYKISLDGESLLGKSDMGDLTRGERLQIMLTKEEVDAVDTWRFSRRMPSRASAVRELLKRGLASEGFAAAEAGRHSSEFGVVEAGEELNKAEK
jgi:hypothetical protein